MPYLITSQDRGGAETQRQFLRLCVSAVIFLVVAANASAQQPSAGFVVDGRSDDWSGITLAHDKTNSVETAAVLDGGRICVLLRTGSPTMQAKMLKAGMTVYFDIEGKKKTSTGLQFPLPKPDEEGDVGPVNMSSARVMGLAKSTEFTLRKFREGNGTFKVGEADPAGVVVAIQVDEQGNLVYEASVPYSSLYGKPAPETADAGKTMDVGFVINALSEPHSLASADTGPNAPPPPGLSNGLGRTGNIPGGGLSSAAPRAGNGRETQEAAQEAYRSTRIWTLLTFK